MQLTQHEWQDALRVPAPYRDKKKFYRKKKHKKGWRSEEQFVYYGRNKEIKIKVMLKKIDFKFLIASVGALSVGLLTMAGVIQHYIHFADPLNEMAFASMAMFGGIIFALGIKK